MSARRFPILVSSALLLSLALAFVHADAVFAAQDDPMLRWKGGYVTIEGGDAEDSSAAQAEEEAAPAPSFLRTFSLRFFSAPVDEDYYVVQFTGPVQPEWKRGLSDMSAVFFDYIPQNAFIIKAEASREADIRALSYVRLLSDFKPEFKVSSGVYDVSPEALAGSGGKVRVRVSAFPGEDVRTVSSAIEERGGSVDAMAETATGPIFEVSISVTDVRALAEIEGVKAVEPAPVYKQSINVGTSIVGVRGVRNKVWSSGGRLLGEGQIVAVADSGLDTGDIATLNEDFGDGAGGSRVVSIVAAAAATASDESGHGTHVAGIVVGNGANSGANPTADDYPETSFAGVAPKAGLYYQSFGIGPTSALTGIPTDLADLFGPAYAAGARVHSDSWGTAGVGDYSGECVALDRFMWDHKDFLVVAAGGNAARDYDQDGVIDRYNIDTPASAKNCLTVGATESKRDSGGFAQRTWGEFATFAEPVGSDYLSDRPSGLAAFSGRGPTPDGRWKPELVAPGTNIVSVRSSRTSNAGWGVYNDKYLYMGGTSMATPLVSGTALLMREYLMKEAGFASPSAALVKTSLIHGATPLDPGQYGEGGYKEIGPAPEPGQGWGRVNLPGSLNISTEREVLYYDVTTAAPADTSYSKTYSFTVADDGAPLRATLGWTDYPGSPLSGGALVNDLDLRVKLPDGSWRYPDNARALNPPQKIRYLSSVNGIHEGPALGVAFTPDSYPSLMSGIVMAYRNAGSIISAVTVTVYSFGESGVGAELFRKRYAFFGSGEFFVPVGIEVASGSVFAAVEVEKTGQGIYIKNGNDSGKAYEASGTTWAAASVTPALIGIFRPQAEATDFDRVNNTVSVTVPKPAPGTYTVEVTAHNIPVGPQPYALVVSGMSSAVDTEGSATIQCNPIQPEAPTVGSLAVSRTTQALESINTQNGGDLLSVYGGVVEYSGVITGNYGNGLVSMRYPVTGLPAGKAGSLVLSKLLGGGKHLTFSYPRYENYADGMWWLTDVGGSFVDPGRELDPAADYYVVSTVKDNGPFDTNSTLNGVRDPQVLGTSASGGSVLGGGGGGCTLGGGGDAGMGLLLAAAALAFALRSARRRP